MFNIPPTDRPEYKPNTWLETLTGLPDDHTVEKKWDMRNRICGTGELVEGDDYSYLQKVGTGVRELWIKIVVTSDPLCLPCGKHEASACLHQRLKVDNAVPDLDPKQTYIDEVPAADCVKWNPPASIAVPGAPPGPKP